MALSIYDVSTIMKLTVVYYKVRDNIDAFDGDKDKITVFWSECGQS